MLRLSIAASLTIALTGCADLTTPGGATEEALCRAWGESLPTRSKSDTDQTAREIQTAYADFANACPTLTHLIP